MYRVQFIHSGKTVYEGDNPRIALVEWTQLNTIAPCAKLEQRVKRLWWMRWKHIKPYDLPLTKEEVIRLYGENRMDSPSACGSWFGMSRHHRIEG